MFTQKQLYLIFLIVQLSLSNIFAQDFFTHLQTPRPNEGTVLIYQDHKLETVVNLYSENHIKEKGIYGYRLNIFRSDDKNEAFQARSKYIEYFGTEPYIRYTASIWKVYVGLFLTKSDAKKLLEEIKYKFPNAFIAPIEIEIPD